MNDVLVDLCDKGNMVLVVEYKLEMIEMVDYVVDFGFGVGIVGGEVVFEGIVKGLW